MLDGVSLTRHHTKGEWNGATRIEHLGIVVDSQVMKVFLAPRKIAKVRSTAIKLLGQARIGQLWVSRDRLASFAGVCVSLTSAILFARFYPCSVYRNMAKRSPRRRDCDRSRTRLSYQIIRDLIFWRSITCAEKDRREIPPPGSSHTLHTDAADIVFGGTLGPDARPGAPGPWEVQGVWGWRDRAQCISFQELKAIALLLTGPVGQRLKYLGLNRLLVRCDNLGAVHITNSMVTVSQG